MSNTTTRRQKTIRMVEMAVLLALLLILAFTPLGYLKLGIVSITFLTVPVIIGAIVLGPAAGAILGGFFGLTSFLQCFGMDTFGTTLFGINPFYTAVLCFAARILMGWLTGIIFKALSKKDKTKLISYGITGICGSVLNTLLFVLLFLVLFGHTDYVSSLMSSMGSATLVAFAAAFVGTNGIIEAVVCFIVAAAGAKALNVFTSKYN